MLAYRQLVWLTVAVICCLLVINLTALAGGSPRTPRTASAPPVGPSVSPVETNESQIGNVTRRRKAVVPVQVDRAGTVLRLGYAKDTWYSPRLHLRNDEGAIAWPSADEDRKETVLRRVMQRCRDPMSRTDEGGERRLRIVGVDGMAAGRWNRFWAVAECPQEEGARGGTRLPMEGDRAWAPCCSAGDVLDVQMESPIAKVAVDRVYDIDDAGVYEVQLYLRKKHPSYTLGVHLVVTGIPRGHRILLANKSMQTGAAASNVTMKPFPLGGHYVPVAVTLGDDVVPIQRPCTAMAAFRPDAKNGGVDLRDRFRFGAWYRLDADACDAVHCDGNTSALETEGWVWASDLCRVQLFTAEEVRERLLKKSTFAWGASTLRQPLDILYSSLLRERRSESGAYPLRWAWSGCTNSSQQRIVQCKAEGSRVGFSTWKPRAAGIFANAPSPFDHVLIERTAWVTDDTSEPVYFSELREWLAGYRKVLAMRAQPKPPIQIFHNFVAWGYGTANYGILPHLNRHWSWLLEDYMIANAPEFTFISRQEMTLPLHFGGVFVSGSQHYGTTSKECSWLPMSTCHSLLNEVGVRRGKIGGCTVEGMKVKMGVYSEKSTAFQEILQNYKRCLRKTHGDAAVVAAWLNIFITG